MRGHQQRQRYLDRNKHLRDHLGAIIRIQAAWKGMLARRQYKNLTKVRLFPSSLQLAPPSSGVVLTLRLVTLPLPRSGASCIFWTRATPILLKSLLCSI